MALIQSFEKTGNVLFKYRGQIPILIFILALPLLFLTNHALYAQLAAGRFVPLRTILTTIAILVSLIGLALRAYTVSTTPKGTSGRNTQKQVAATLNTYGIYSVVRHPLYLANYLIWAGLLIFSMNVMAFILISLVYWLYYERIMFAEEAFLRQRFGQDFETWAARVPAFIPNFTLFQRGTMSFSFKTFVRREYVTLFSTIASYTVVDYALFMLITVQHTALCTLSSAQWLRPSGYILIVALLAMLLIRFLKHHTDVLQSDSKRD